MSGVGYYLGCDLVGLRQCSGRYVEPPGDRPHELDIPRWHSRQLLDEDKESGEEEVRREHLVGVVTFFGGTHHQAHTSDETEAHGMTEVFTLNNLLLPHTFAPGGDETPPQRHEPIQSLA